MRTLRQQVRLAMLRAYGAAATRAPAPALHSGRVLAIRPDHLGDLLLSVPALGHIKKRIPGCHVGLMVGPWNLAAAAGIPYVDEVLPLAFPWFDRRPKAGFLRPYRLLEEAAQGLQGGWDAAVVLRHDFWWGAMLAARAGIPRRVGYDLAELRPFLTDALPYEPQHEVEQTVRLAEAVTGTRARRASPLRFDPSAKDREAARGWLDAEGVIGPFVVIHPGAGAAVKQWEAARFAAVGGALTQEMGVRVVLTGSVAETPLVEMVAAALQGEPAPPTLLGAPLGQVAAVLARSAVAVGADSGIMHLAAAVGTPTVRLYGPVDVARFGPWGDPRQHRVVRTDPPCVPCNRLDFSSQELGLHPCVRAIPVGAVVAAARELLNRRGALTLTLSQRERGKGDGLSQRERGKGDGLSQRERGKGDGLCQGERGP